MEYIIIYLMHSMHAVIYAEHLQTCEPSRIIREPPGNAAQLPHSREWDRTSRMWKYKKKKNIFFFLFFFQTIIFAHMYGNNGHLLLEGN